MPSTAFSLTERVIINPVLYMRAELLNDPEFPPGKGKKICHFIEAEIFARITAIFTSVFAVTDAFVHFLAGCYKGTSLLLDQCCYIRVSWNKSEVYEHFRAAAFFSAIALVGSVVGAIWPGIFKYFKQSPSDPFNGGDSDPFSGTNSDSFNGGDSHRMNSVTPETILYLASAVQAGVEQTPFNRLRNLWRHSSLSSKRWFVQTFNLSIEKFTAVRRTLADLVYRPIIASVPLRERRIQWLNEKEVSAQVNNAWERTNSISKGFFFHATSEKALESILKAKKVEVRHEKAYRGAFVSTQPELSFGRCVLAFKRNIERLSKLEHGFTINQKTYWAGFSRDIPVSGSTLAYIILDSQNEKEREALETQCEQWTGRKINVILMGDAQGKLDQVGRLEMGIPQEWPEEGEQSGQKILNAMTISMAVPQRLAVQKKERVAVAQTSYGRQYRGRQMLAVAS